MITCPATLLLLVMQPVPAPDITLVTATDAWVLQLLLLLVM